MNKCQAHILWVLLACPAISAYAQPWAGEVACAVQGHDLILYNRSEAPMPAGVIIEWSAWDGRREGLHTLTEPLEPDVGLTLSSALGASYFWDRPCQAQVTQAQDELKRNGTIDLQGGQGNAPVAKP